MTRIRFAAYSFVFAALLVGACTTEGGSSDPVCDSGDILPCDCDGGEDGNQTCNTQGSGWSACECGGGSGGSSGSGGGGSGGESDSGIAGNTATGGSAGSTPDGSADGAVDAAADAAIVMDGSATLDASPTDAMMTEAGANACLGDDAGGLDECNFCIFQNCCDEALNCVEPDPCDAEGDAGFDEADCMDQCFLLALDSDAGVLDGDTLEECASLCANSGDEVSDATFFYAGCLLLNCEAECYPGG